MKTALQTILRSVQKLSGRQLTQHPAREAASPLFPLLRIRPATEQDIDQIVALTRAEARNGHFHPGLAHDERVVDGLRLELRSLIALNQYIRPKQGEVGALSNVQNFEELSRAFETSFEVFPGWLEVLEVDQHFAGFQILHYLAPMESPQTTIEYYHLAILPHWRRQELATLLVQRTLHHLPKELAVIARLYPASEVMYQILLKQGFILKEVTPTGTRKLTLPPRA